MTAGLGHGQVWWADLPGDKVRPVVVLTRAAVAPMLSRVLVAPVTTVVRGLRTEVPLGAVEGVREGSVANLDNVQLVGVDRLLRLAGRVGGDRWPEVCSAMAAAIACADPGRAAAGVMGLFTGTGVPMPGEQGGT
jgi:mRNA interferase MazF